MFAKCQYVPEGNEMRLMQLNGTGPALDGFTMEHNKHVICCGMSGLLEPGALAVGGTGGEAGFGGQED